MIKIQPTGPKALTLADVPEGRVAFVDNGGFLRIAEQFSSDLDRRYVVGSVQPWSLTTPIRAILTEPQPPTPLTIGDLTEPCIVETEDGAVLAVSLSEAGGDRRCAVLVPSAFLRNDVRWVSERTPCRQAYTVTREG